jgi:hypothetical protein
LSLPHDTEGQEAIGQSTEISLSLPGESQTEIDTQFQTGSEGSLDLYESLFSSESLSCSISSLDFESFATAECQTEAFHNTELIHYESDKLVEKCSFFY